MMCPGSNKEAFQTGQSQNMAERRADSELFVNAPDMNNDLCRSSDYRLLMQPGWYLSGEESNG